jgi:hypothetical protein
LQDTLNNQYALNNILAPKLHGWNLLEFNGLNLGKNGAAKAREARSPASTLAQTYCLVGPSDWPVWLAHLVGPFGWPV